MLLGFKKNVGKSDKGFNIVLSPVLLIKFRNGGIINIRAFSDLAESFGGFSFVVDCDSLDSTTLMEVSDDPALFC